jgi:acyl-CoA synthetase (NDP forming)
MLSNSPNYGDFSMISIVGVIFSSKLRYLTPPGVPIYQVPPTVMQLILKIYRVLRNDVHPLPRRYGQCQYNMSGTHKKVHSIRFIRDKK